MKNTDGQRGREKHRTHMTQTHVNRQTHRGCARGTETKAILGKAPRLRIHTQACTRYIQLVRAWRWEPVGRDQYWQRLKNSFIMTLYKIAIVKSSQICHFYWFESTSRCHKKYAQLWLPPCLALEVLHLRLVTVVLFLSWVANTST